MRRRGISKYNSVEPSIISPEFSNIWDCVVSDIRDSLKSAGYQNSGFAFTQEAAVFSDKILNKLNISAKEALFTVKYKSKNTIVLGAPGPVGILKTVIDNNIPYQDEPLKLFDYGISLIDDDNNSSTAPKQFHIFKAECIGDVNPVRDAEIILTAYRMLESQGIGNLAININVLGNSDSRDKYYKELLSKIPSRFKNLSTSLSYNPIKLYNELLSVETDINIRIPQIVDYLGSEETQYFNSVLEFLDTLDIPYNLEPTLSGSIGFNEGVYFEIMSQDYPDMTLVRGGRHNELFELLSGCKGVGAVGIEIYVDLLLQIAKKMEPKNLVNNIKPDIFVASIGLEGQKSALKILSLIQKHGLGVKESFGIKSLRQQLLKAKKSDAEITLIIGRKEAVDGTVILRDKASENQEIVPIDKLISILCRKLSK
ncbi:MAG: ATP phosphoribosyltransferase regulatory subunit [Candidatus Paceibacterota bacterium]